jgi:hypothetical protein
MAFPLRNQIRHVGRILGVVLVPPAVYKRSILLDGVVGHIDDQISPVDQKFSQGLVIYAGRLNAEHRLVETIAGHVLPNMRNQTFKSLFVIGDNQSP